MIKPFQLEWNGNGIFKMLWANYSTNFVFHGNFGKVNFWKPVFPEAFLYEYKQTTQKNKLCSSGTESRHWQPSLNIINYSNFKEYVTNKVYRVLTTSENFFTINRLAKNNKKYIFLKKYYFVVFTHFITMVIFIYIDITTYEVCWFL